MKVKPSINTLELKMAFVLKYFYCLYVFIYTSILLPGVVSGQIDAEGVYKLLSWRLDDILTETKTLKSKVDNIDIRLKSVEEKMQEIQTTTPNSIELKIADYRQELQKELKETIDTQALAVKKMLFTEKKLLRDSMNNFKALFADLKSEIQTHMLEFNASLKEGINNIGTEFDNLKSDIQLEMSAHNKTLSDALSSSNATLEVKLEDMNEIVNNNSIMITTGIAELTSNWNSTTHNVSQILQTMERSMVSNSKETETRILAEFDKKQSATQTTLASLQTNLNTLSSTVAYTIQPELKSLSSRISSVSSSLSSESFSLSSRISSLSDRIYEEEKRKVAFSVRMRNQPDSIYLPKEKIIFDDVFYNEGSGYSTSSGIFTAPKTGTYIFTVNTEATDAGKGMVSLMVRGHKRCEALAEKGYDNTGGCTTVAYVYSGDQAWVQASDIDLPRHYVYKYRTQFNGFLID